jgi:hypothetical protein
LSTSTSSAPWAASTSVTADVGHQPAHAAAGALAQRRDRAVERVGPAAADHDPMAGQQQPLGAGVADAGGAAADECGSRADGGLPGM